MWIILTVGFLLILPISSTDPSCKGQLNLHDIVHDEPRFVKEITNAKHYIVGQGYDQINIVHVYGNTPYDMGYALGKLMSDDLKAVITAYFDYLDQHVEGYFKDLPPVKFLFYIDFNFIFLLVCCQINC